MVRGFQNDSSGGIKMCGGHKKIVLEHMQHHGKALEKLILMSLTTTPPKIVASAGFLTLIGNSWVFS